jgi:glyoxylate/hydroxypyruvate/2-ketogluconate reductase
MNKPKLWVSRAIFPDLLAQLHGTFDVVDNQDDTAYEPAAWAARLSAFDAVFTAGVEPITAAVLAQCPRLKIAANMTVGYNNFDVPAMTAAGVLATNAPDVLTEATADMAFALLLSAARRVTESEIFLRRGLWDRWRYDMFLGAPVHGTTLGVLGMGRIGQAIARRGALGFGMQVVYHNRNPLPAESSGKALGYQARYLALEELFEQADHVVVVLPYSKAVHHLVGKALLDRMKPLATLVNIGRGGLIDEDALANALETGQLGGAGLDVFEGEPLVNPRLLAQKNIVMTPHIGSATGQARRAMAQLAIDNLLTFFTQGRALTPLNPEVLARNPLKAPS